MRCRNAFMLSLSVCLGACVSQPHKAELEEIAKIEAAGDLERADREYGDFLMSTPLQDDAHREVARDRCAVRDKIVLARLEAAKDPTRQELLELLKFSRMCSSASTQSNTIFEMMVARTERDIEQEVQPLYEAKQYGQMLGKAGEYSHYLPADHRYATWFGQVRALMAKSWKAQSDEVLQGGFYALSFYLALLSDDASKTTRGPTMPAKVVQAIKDGAQDLIVPKVDVTLGRLDVEAGDDACAKDFARVYHGGRSRRAPLSVASNAKAVILSCAAEVSSAPHDATRVKVTLSFKGRMALTSQLEGVETSSTAESDFAFSSTRYEPRALTLGEAKRAFFAPSIGVSLPDAELADHARERIRVMHDKAQLAPALAHASQDAKDELVAVERMLGAFFLGHTLTDAQHARIRAMFGTQLSGYPQEMMPVVTWYQSGVHEQMPRNRLTDVELRARMNRGVPATVAMFGAHYQSMPRDLVGQPDRSAIGVSVNTPYRKGLLRSKGRLKGLGALVGADFGVHLGARLGGDYQDVTTPMTAAPYTPDEEPASFGAHVGALAMLGWRGERLGLFVGIKPGLIHRRVGFYVTQGGYTPLVARLEIRRRHAAAYVLEAWWGNINADERETSSMGGQLMIPLGSNDSGFTSSGVALYGQQDVLPAHFYGLNQLDDVRLEQATLMQGGLGYWMGF